MAWTTKLAVLGSLLLLAVLVNYEVNAAKDPTDQVMEAIKKASAKLPGGMKISVMGGDEANEKVKEAQKAKDEDDADDEEKSEGDDDDDDDDDKEEADTENDVVVLTDSTFDDYVFSVSERAPVLVEFYAPWCGHCKSLQPEYEKAATRLKNLKHPVYLAKVDATEEPDIAQKYDVKGYPTLKWFRNGVAYDYDGGRDEDGIFDYMKARSSPDWKPPPVAVLTLTTENFTDFINGYDLSLVEFYAPWCGHCKKLAPEYEKAAQRLSEGDDPIPLAKVDATQDGDLAKDYDVTGYPTMKVFRRGQVYDYNGGRDEFGIISYMEKQRGAPSTEQSSLKELQRAQAVDDVTVVGFFEDEDIQFSRFIEAANILRDDYTIVHTFEPEALEHYKVNPNSLVILNAERYQTKFEPKMHTFTISEDNRASDLQSFISEHNVPLVGEYNNQSSNKRYTNRPLVLFFYTVDFSHDGVVATQLWRKRIASIAKEFKDMTFAVADEEKNSKIWKEFGFEESGEEMNVGILGAEDKKFPMEANDEFDSDAITEFLQSFKDGKAKPIIKSQPIPKKQKLVKVVVGNNFEKIVMDPKKDVLLEMYAPWCGHCKKLEPAYNKLAKKYKKEKNLVIAKMDATANDAPAEYKAEGFPTIYFAPAGDKLNPVKMDGGRELSDFVSFLEEQATVSLGKEGIVKEEL